MVLSSVSVNEVNEVILREYYYRPDVWWPHNYPYPLLPTHYSPLVSFWSTLNLSPTPTLLSTHSYHNSNTRYSVESVQQVVERVSSLVTSLEARYTDKYIILTSHADTLQIMQTYLAGYYITTLTRNDYYHYIMTHHPITNYRLSQHTLSIDHHFLTSETYLCLLRNYIVTYYRNQELIHGNSQAIGSKMERCDKSPFDKPHCCYNFHHPLLQWYNNAK